MTPDEKIDKLLLGMESIQKHIAAQEVHNKYFHDRISEAEGVTEQYKKDRAGIMGASIVISAVVGFFSSLFKHA